jgi:hypothetical protein
LISRQERCCGACAALPGRGDRDELSGGRRRQFVVIAAGGSILLQSAIGDALIAFTLRP